jgi:hypothetical protein
MDEQLVSTPVGTARLDWFPTQGRQRATVVLGHGTATGVEATDLQALAQALPPLGIAVVLMTQPYRVERNPRVADEASLDRAWRAIWPRVSGLGEPLIAQDRRSRAARHVRSALKLCWPSPTRCSAQGARPNCWAPADQPWSYRAGETPSVALISSRSCRRRLSS